MQIDRTEVQLNAALTRAGRMRPRESFDMRAELEALLRATAHAAYPETRYLPRQDYGNPKVA